MREIKFRAWDEKEKCWVGGFAIHQNGMFSDWAGCKEVNGKCYADANWEQLKNIPHIKIMQYTGLKDKNGCEIYEGDLLTDYGEAPPVYVEYSEEHGAYCFVDKFDPSGTVYYTPQMIYYEQMEIIGNIYEHPHLIGGKHG